MQKFPVAGVKLAKFALGLSLAATLAACGGGGGDSPAAAAGVAKAQTVAVNAETGPTIVAAVAGSTFDFPAVPAFDNTPIKVTLGGTATAPTFARVAQ